MGLLERQRWLEFHFRYDFQKHEDALHGLVALGPDGKAAIPDVAKLLDDHLVSQMAAHALYRIGSNSVPTLKDALTNRNQWARSHAAGVLGVLHDPSSVSNLLVALKDSDVHTRIMAAQALRRFPEQADVIVPALIICLDDPDDVFRGNVARVLTRFGAGAKPAIPKLQKMVESADYNLSTTTAKALMQIDFEGTLAAFTNNLTSADVNVRRTSAWALILFKSEGRPAVPSLVKCLKDQDTKVRENAAVALREIGEEPDLVVPALMENLNGPDLELRSTTAIALSNFGDRAKPAVPVILKLIEENKGDELTVGALYDALARVDPDAAAKSGGH
jgi:HEAT repeat protein